MEEQQKDNIPEKGATDRNKASIKLVIRGNASGDRAEGEADYILQRRPAGDPDTAGMDDPDITASEENPELIETRIRGDRMHNGNNLSEYIASLTDHMPEDVTRVVDAIIEEESRLPTDLPTLDENLSRIFPVSDVSDELDVEADPVTAPSQKQEEDESPEERSSGNLKYVNKVEYEDL